MNLKNMKCSNCGGNVKMIGNCYMCESCGSSFAVDYDAEDVEYNRIELEREKLQFEQNVQQNAQQNAQQNMQQNMQQFGRPVNRPVATAKTNSFLKLFLFIFAIIFVLSFIAPIMVFLGVFKMFDKVSDKMEDPFPLSAQANQVMYVRDPDRILDDQEFVKEINDAFYSKIKNDIPKSGAAVKWEQQDVSYITSFFLYGIEEETESRNRLLSIYKTTWVTEETTIEVYNAMAVDNLKWDEESQKVRCNYEVKRLTGSNVIGGAFINGTENFEDIRREQVLGMQGDYAEVDLSGNTQEEPVQ